MKKIPVLLLLLSVMSIAAFAQTTQNISVGFGKQMRASKSRLTVKVVAIEDSRCPQGVDCIWAGNAKVTLEITARRGQKLNVELNTNLGAKSARFDGHLIELKDVTPYPSSDKPTDPKVSVAKFAIVTPAPPLERPKKKYSGGLVRK